MLDSVQQFYTLPTQHHFINTQYYKNHIHNQQFLISLLIEQIANILIKHGQNKIKILICYQT